MAKQYYLKDKKALIYKLVKQGKNSFGATSSTGTYWQPTTAAPVWCYTRQLSQNLEEWAYAVGQDETRLFVFNYRTDVVQSDLILYRGKWYNVTRTDTQDDYKTEVFVYVDDLGGTTKPQGKLLNYGDPIPED